MRARDQSSIFSTGRKFRPNYRLLLELHALTLVARSYVLLVRANWSNIFLQTFFLKLGRVRLLAKSCPQATPRFYLAAVEKNWEKDWIITTPGTGNGGHG